MGCFVGGIIFALFLAFAYDIGVGMILLLLVIAGFGILFLAAKDSAEKRQVQEDELKEKVNAIVTELKNDQFETTQWITLKRDSLLLALDEAARKICLVHSEHGSLRTNEQYTIDYISYDQLIESHILEDNVSTTKTSRGSQLGGALLGGILAGGVGAVIGGLSGQKKTSDKVK